MIQSPDCYPNESLDRDMSQSPTSYPKGFKPFKGKGGAASGNESMGILLRELERVETEIARLGREARRIEVEVNDLPETHAAGIRIRIHRRNASGLPVLRWREAYHEGMRTRGTSPRTGDHVWREALEQGRLSEPVRHDLYQHEVRRLMHNTQASLLNEQRRWMASAIQRLKRAQAVLERRWQDADEQEQ
ncbi:DUF3158 family protein [Halomonas daqingensis]|nr:DUF3158 family protein [Halomonas desiderata]